MAFVIRTCDMREASTNQSNGISFSLLAVEQSTNKERLIIPPHYTSLSHCPPPLTLVFPPQSPLTLPANAHAHVRYSAPQAYALPQVPLICP